MNQNKSSLDKDSRLKTIFAEDGLGLIAEDGLGLIGRLLPKK
jgi:hypothetical protein